MKRILASVIALMIAVIPQAAFAAEKTADVNVTISVAGELKVLNEAYSVKDVNGNGNVDVDDVLSTVCGDYGVTYTSDETGWGLSITELWGDASGAYGYYINDEMVMTDLKAPVKSGDYIAAFSFKDTVTYADSYAFFDKKKIYADEGETVVINLSKVGFDESYNPVVVPLAGAEILVDGLSAGTTDAEGNVSLAFEKGVHNVTAVSDGAVPPVCTVYAGDVEDDPGEIMIDTGNGGDSLKDNTPKTGSENHIVLWLSALLLAMAGIGAMKKKMN